MKKLLLASAAVACMLFSANAQTPTDPPQPQLVEKVTANPGDLIISYEKWRLPNGMTVIVHEDHSDPIVHVDVTYHVGSARETPGKSGFAHFFEHMMFQGSDHVADEEHFKIVQGAGGDMNGTTNRDRTNYFETLPKNYLETALWLESDRMGFLLNAVTQKKFEVQRSTVKNEKGQNVDNRPYGRLDEYKNQILYPANHPYSWSTIGYVEDLDRVSVEDLKNFFMRWYGPNNASLVVAGDINTQDVLKLSMKYFGSIPRGPEVRKQRVDPVLLPDNVYANYGDNIVLPLTYVTYPSVANYHPDEAALDVLASVLGNGNNSILYKNFVKSEKAIQAFAQNPCSELAGEFTIGALSFPGNDVDMEALIKQTLEEFNKTGVSDDDMSRAKAQFEANYVQSMESVAGKASALAQWNYLLPNKPMNVKDEIARYNKVTKEDVMRVFRQYIYGKNAAIVNVWAKKKDPDAKEGEKAKEETKAVTSSGKASTELEYKGLTYKKPVDNFDRSQKPEIASAVAPVVPSMYRATFDNGLKVIGSSSSEVPFVSMILTVKGGNNAMADDLGKSGLAALTASMMGESTQNHTSEQFANELEKLGSSINFNATRDAVTMTVNAPKKNLDATLKLVEEKLLRPKFTAEDFKLIQKQTAEGINAERVNAADQANKAYARLLYGKSILAEPVNGTIKNIRGMGVKDVQSFYDKFFSPSVSNLVVVGDITEAEIMPKLGFLKTWAKKEVMLPPVIAAPVPITQTQIYIVDKYKAAQSELRVGYRALPYDYNGKFFKSTVMNFPLGGNFNSRLNLNLREDKGFTYGIRGGFQGTKAYGSFTVSAGVRATSTDSSLKEIFYELNKYRETGISQEELSYTKKALSQGDALRYETPFDKAIFLGQIARYDLPVDYISQQNSILQAITKAEVDELAKEMLPIDKMVIVVVGDKEKIMKSLEKLELNYQPGYKSPTGGMKIVDYKLD
ncbi:MAG: pitrilysin family protein [Bacteroidota bacterium]